MLKNPKDTRRDEKRIERSDCGGSFNFSFYFPCHATGVFPAAPAADCPGKQRFFKPNFGNRPES
jgi:hypothetical protein